LFQISKPGNSEAGTAGAFCVVGLILREGRTYNMAYDELLAPVLKSIQQHQQEIADKTASFERHRAARRQKLADLKTKIAELKEQIQNLTAGQIH
jgi:phage shock protein A